MGFINMTIYRVFALICISCVHGFIFDTFPNQGPVSGGYPQIGPQYPGYPVTNGGGPGGDPLKQQEHTHAHSLGCTSRDACSCSNQMFYPNLNCYMCFCDAQTTSAIQKIPTIPPSSASFTHAQSNQVPTTMHPITSSTPSPLKSTAAITTATAEHTTSTRLPITTTNSPSTTSGSVDYCAVAEQLCHLNCPDGYLVDPSDCTFCVCKKDVIGTGK